MGLERSVGLQFAEAPRRVMRSAGRLHAAALIACMFALLAAGRAEARPIATSVSAATGQTCFSMASGSIECAGKSYLPQRRSAVPVRFPGIQGAAAVQAGIRYQCALLRTAAVECWGDNGFGQLGNGSTDDSAVPVRVRGISSAVAVSTGGTHTCAVLVSGRVMCWGRNVGGSLGDGTLTDRHTPVEVRGISNAVGVSAGVISDETCAVLAGGRVYCWGPNPSGQLGNGTHITSAVPVRVTGITNAIQVAAGGSHVCAVLATGAIDCWGKNDVGQLGNGTTRWAEQPVRVKGITDARAVAVAAHGYSCAVLHSGKVRCWGHNEKAQLGTGHPTQPSLVPIAVLGVAHAVSITTGIGHACSLLSSGGAECWGYDDYGRMGFGGGPPGIRGATPVLFGAG